MATVTITRTICDFCKEKIQHALMYYRLVPLSDYDEAPPFSCCEPDPRHIDLHQECARSVLLTLDLVGVNYWEEPVRKVTIDNMRGGKMTVDDPSQHFRYIYIDAVNVNVVHAFSANEAE